MFFYFFFFLFFNWKGFGENVGFGEKIIGWGCVYMDQPTNPKKNNPSMMHGSGKMGAAPASDTTTLLPTCQCHVWFFFFFFYTDSRWLSTNSCQFAPNWADSPRIRPYRPTTEMAKTGQNRPWISSEKPKFPPQRHINVFLAFFFLCFVNQGLVMCFLRIF